MNLPPYYGKGYHYWQAPFPHRQSNPSDHAPGTPSTQNSERPLSQYHTQPHSGHSHIQVSHGINNGFRLLNTNPKGALDEAEILLKKCEGDPNQYVRVVQLKARALFLLEDFDGCIGYINSLSNDIQNNKGVVMAKARALQARGHLIEALSLFQHLYAKYSASFNDEKNHGV
ncbi:tetratricopeptide repeat protein, partial [Sansalvadorimonas verongulae]|uniref:hypothetical protein n=1 Tax=Sansalvadorimonas verongulae TaxID=2172824 RepID=UPI0012BBF45F